jgi:hypothetical protein
MSAFWAACGWRVANGSGPAKSLEKGMKSMILLRSILLG